jgi:hypothetical protein
MTTQSSQDPSEALENARVEYGATHEAYIHYDDLTWKVGTVLIASVFIFWGFLLDKKPDLDRMYWANLMVCVILSVWALYAAHNRQIYRYKVHRLHELELLLGMAQHLRFVGASPVYRTTGPHGHWLNNATYAIAALGGALLGLFAAPYEQWASIHLALYAANILIVVATLLWIRRIGIETDEILKAARASGGTTVPPVPPPP